MLTKTPEETQEFVKQSKKKKAKGLICEEERGAGVLVGMSWRQEGEEEEEGKEKKGKGKMREGEGEGRVIRLHYIQGKNYLSLIP